MPPPPPLQSLNNSKLDAIVEELKRWFQDTTIHGIPKIYKTKNVFLRTFWIVGYFSCLVYLLYAIMAGFLHFLEFDVITQVMQKRHGSMPFPTISICNKYPFKMYSNPNVTQIITSIYSNPEVVSGMTNKSMSLYDLDRDLEYMARYALLEQDFNRTHRLQFSYTIEEMLIQCVYSNRDCSSNLTWNFERSNFSYRYGYCYKFNSGRDVVWNRNFYSKFHYYWFCFKFKD
jgi:hypothetical protein